MRDPVVTVSSVPKTEPSILKLGTGRRRGAGVIPVF
jgi:hypothetical protein